MVHMVRTGMPEKIESKSFLTIFLSAAFGRVKVRYFKISMRLWFLTAHRGLKVICSRYTIIVFLWYVFISMVPECFNDKVE